MQSVASLHSKTIRTYPTSKRNPIQVIQLKTSPRPDKNQNLNPDKKHFEQQRKHSIQNLRKPKAYSFKPK
jgi:hypothetical protein